MDIQIILAALLGAVLVLLIAVLVLLIRKPGRSAFRELRAELTQRLSETEDGITGTVRALNESNMTAVSLLGQTLSEGQRSASEAQSTHFASFEGKMGVALAGQKQVVEGLKSSVTEQVAQLRSEVHTQIDTMDKELTEDQRQLNESVGGKLTQLQSSMSEQMSQFREMSSAQLRQFGSSTEEKLEALRGSMTDSMKLMREENGKKLDEIRGTVDEKLQTTLEKRISESFKTVNEQL